MIFRKFPFYFTFDLQVENKKTIEMDKEKDLISN